MKATRKQMIRHIVKHWNNPETETGGKKDFNEEYFKGRHLNTIKFWFEDAFKCNMMRAINNYNK